MELGGLLVDKEGVRNPDLGQECPVESEFIETTGVETETILSYLEATALTHLSLLSIQDCLK